MQARFEVSTAVKSQAQVFWVVTPLNIALELQRHGGPEDGSRKVFVSYRNTGDVYLNSRCDVSEKFLRFEALEIVRKNFWARIPEYHLADRLAALYDYRWAS
jgi:hypothetical protein